LMLLLARGEFNHQGLLHTYIVDYIVLQIKYLIEEGRIPLSPEGDSLLRQRL
jgi:very-short-patch-repair endonuclease